MEKCKTQAGQDDEDGGFMTLGGMMCQVLPNGAKSKGKGPYRAFCVLASGMRFEFGKSKEPKGNCPNAKVAIGSATLMQLGLQEAWSRAQAFIEALGGEVVANKLSRVDGCLDMPGVATTELSVPYWRRDFVCRAVDDTAHRTSGIPRSFKIGNEPMCRIYDKVREMMGGGVDMVKLRALIANRWHDRCNWHEAPRVEWQMRRQTIKELGIDSVEDWLANRAGVIEYLSDWLRFVDTQGEPFDRKHPERYPTLPIWEVVKKGFLAWTGESSGKVCRMTPGRCGIKPDVLRRMIGGCALTLYAQIGVRWGGKDALKESMNRELDVWLQQQTDGALGEKWLRKKREFEAATIADKAQKDAVLQEAEPFNQWAREAHEREKALAEAGGPLPGSYWLDDLATEDQEGDGDE
ncbi:MAG: hypothetical protein ABFC63_07595 [Thermoguttaceae bacterium]